MGGERSGVLVSTDWLEGQLDDPDLRVFECTFYLRPAAPDEGVPYHPESGRADYATGHIPRAGFLDLPGELSRQDTPLRFMMPEPDAFAAAVSRSGVGDGVQVVLYGRGSVMSATRVWWMLHAMGFDAAAVLDGGWEKWIGEGRPVSREPCRYAPATFVPRPRAGLFVDKHDVLGALGDERMALIHTLSAADFRGDGPSRYGRPGRIPGSVNLPWPELIDPQTHAFIPLDEARARFEALGPDHAERIVCYCGGGISATMALFLLHRLGHDNLALYDGSMGEWARDDALPLERG